MLRKRGYKFEARPNDEQLRNLRRFAGACRFVYNKALALKKERYEKKEKRLGYAGLCALLPKWKTEFAWLSDVPAGLALLACSQSSAEGRPSWQEPTEGIRAYT